jgi:hypothetical protein
LSEIGEHYKEYFSHNRAIESVLSLICGFIFTAIILFLTTLPNPSEIFAQATLLFLTITFYLSLYVLIDNLEMGFHYIEKIPPLTLRVAPFFWTVIIFYLFGTATVMMFVQYGLFYLAIVSGAIWAIMVIISMFTVVKPFFDQAKKRDWTKK